MKFVFDKKTLVDEITVAQKISTKNAGAVLSNVFLAAEDSVLTIKATDTKGSFQTKIPVETVENGSVTVFCDKLMSILATIPDGEAEFSLQEKDGIFAVIQSKTAKIKYKLKCLSQDKFPEIPVADEKSFFSVPAKDFKEMVKKTSFSVSVDITRYFMTGVFFEKKGDKLALVATDGRRLAFSSKEIPGLVDFTSVIVPPKVLDIVIKKLSDEGSVDIAISEKNIFFKFGNCIFSENLIDGQFPNYVRVIPASHTGEFVISKEELDKALKHISVMTDKAQKILLGIAPGVCSVSSTSVDFGEAKEEIACQYAGEECTFAINYKYLADFLKTALNEDVTFEFTDELKAIVLKQKSAEDYIHIIMPMQK